MAAGVRELIVSVSGRNTRGGPGGGAGTRPELRPDPEAWADVVRRVKAGELSHREAAAAIGMSDNGFRRRYVKMEGEAIPTKTNRVPPDWEEVCGLVKAGKLTKAAAAIRLGMPDNTFRKHYKRDFEEDRSNYLGKWRKPEGWDALADAIFRGELTMAEVGRRLHMDGSSVKDHIQAERLYREKHGIPIPERTMTPPRMAPAVKAKRSPRAAAEKRSRPAERKVRAESAIGKSDDLPRAWPGVIQAVKALLITHTEAAKALKMTPDEMRRIYYEQTGERLPRIWYIWRDLKSAGAY